MHLQFALFADAANVSQEGKLNILGVFDALQVAGLPSIHPRCTFVLRLKATGEDEGDHEVGLAWVNPEGAVLWSSTGHLQVGPAPEGADGVDLPLIAQLDLPLDQPGLYRMQVSVDGTEMALVPMHVALPALAGAFPLAPSAPQGLVS
ncbi:MAG: hypothetical protein MUF21_09570 [Gemmatimonadaceae bacterium]|jgi:hypothetical protein|nr:hypothetical protein [Gemmatimonadaceae bacterium]